MKYSINVNGNEKIPFNNNVNYCVGTGRMRLALTKEYYDQLKIVQQDIGFKFIRGHGLFCDADKRGMVNTPDPRSSGEHVVHTRNHTDLTGERIQACDEFV